MKKELLTAIAIGAIFGFIITAAFWLIQEGKLKEILEKETEITKEEVPQKNQEEKEETQTGEEEKTEKIYLKVESPENESVLAKSLQKITGQTQPSAFVVVLHEEGDEITTADEDGNFEISIELNGGLNVVKIISFNSDGESTETILHLTYSTAKI